MGSRPDEFALPTKPQGPPGIRAWLADGARLVARGGSATVSALLRSRARRVGVGLLLAFVLLFTATVRTHLHGRLYGLYLLRSATGRPFELKDDLRLGDGPRLIGGVSFAALRGIFSAGETTGARLALDWDARDGSAVVDSFLPDGRRLQSVFGRFVDDAGESPGGLFVGGAIAEVSATPAQNQSGMAIHDARGWHHVWCNANEILVVGPQDRSVFPRAWTLTDSRVLVDAKDRVVLETGHELAVDGARLRMERRAYFKAGRTFFKLGISFENLGDEPVRISFGYGDEPWVGEFGSAEGNLGWTPGGIVGTVTIIDARREQWGGIIDTKSGLANFLSWEGSDADLVYFGNHAGTPTPEELGLPLTSNEIFIGAEWRDRTLQPGDVFSVRLTIGLAGTGRDGLPTFPSGAVTPR